MAIDPITLGDITISRLIIGGNPFSGVSHQGADRDHEMTRWYTVERIKATLRDAEEQGMDTFIGRADRHITRLLHEYWDEGGTIKWIAQTCPEMASIERSIDDAIINGAVACYVHGGVMDNLYAAGRLDQVPPAIRKIRDAGLPAGIAGHNPDVFRWAEENLDLDFYMCSYYNSANRNENAEHVSGMPEWFNAVDRDTMCALIGDLSRPVIHYKIFAAGRNDPREAMSYTANHLRRGDGICFGVFTRDNPSIISDNIRLYSECVTSARSR